MEAQNEGPDEPSLPAVSSLRSKFESLTRTTTAQSTISRPQLSSNTSNGLAPVVPRRLQSQNLRPQSMIEHADPREEVGKPRASFDSPRRDDIHAERSVFREVPSLGMKRSDETSRRGIITPTSATFSTSPRPPTKPQVPQKKPALLARYSEANTAVAVPATLATRGLPTPAPQELSSPQIDSLQQRGRVSSDASWVERVRGVSDASLHPVSPVAGRTSPKKITRSARVDSNASWVETSTLQEASDNEDEAIPSLPPRPIAPQEISGTGETNRAPSQGIPPGYTTAANTAPLPVRTSSLAPQVHLPPKPKTALAQGFERPQSVYEGAASATSSTTSLVAPPAVPPPRRSLDRRRELTPEAGSSNLQSFAKTSTISMERSPREIVTYAERSPTIQPLTRSATVSRAIVEPPPSQTISRASTFSKAEPDLTLSEKDQDSSVLPFPDISTSNRRPPTWRQRPSQIHTEYDTRLVALSGNHVCTTGFITKVWDHQTGQQLVSIVHPEAVKVTAIRFISGSNDQLWLGTSSGDLHEVDIQAQRIVDTSQRAHRGREVIRIYKSGSEMWSLDESGNLAIWQNDARGSPSLQAHFGMFHTQRGHTASIVCSGQLWIATGKEIRRYSPSATTDAEFNTGKVSLLQMNIGDVTSVTSLQGCDDVLFFGHTDGKVSIWDKQSMRCRNTVHISLNKISHLYGVGTHLWAGYGSGVMQAYDTSNLTWNTRKEWQAHSKQISGIVCDTSSDDRFKVATLGADNVLKLWDGMFEDDWLDDRLHAYDSNYCSFDEVTVSVLTWNAGAVKPSQLQHRIEDDNFLREYIDNNAAANILVFGFQELVDLEDKKLTAKSFFKSKKKDAFEQEHMTHQYRAWRDHLTLRVKEYTNEEYLNLHTASMIGLFTCIFVKASIRHRIKHVHQAEIKRGMGGLYGNKGALVLRFVIDDSSICFVNCHLAAGQAQTAARNTDAATILETECLPPWPLSQNAQVEHADVFTSGGDGSSILDHELCILNGDLNYRIDTMSRDTVIKYVQQQNLARLLERDQLLLSRKKNPGFKLRAFQEKQIQFSPTYKYNVNSNEYDSSEKKRSPAWCDRILYRGLGKVRCDQYRRWEVRVSDHRPVSASLTCRVKTIDPARRARVLQQCLQELEVHRRDAERLLHSAT